MLADLIEQATKAIQHYEQRGQRPTERETIDKLVLPFMEHVLGADYHDPATVTAEFDADIGPSKGEKVDYAIHRGGKPVILIECKALDTSLDGKTAQLQRYIGALPQVSLGLLTDGRHYRFHADLDNPNILDAEPFLSVDLLNLTPSDEERLKLFHMDRLDVEEVKNIGRGWKTVASLVQALENEWKEPSDGYITHFAKPLYKKGPMFESVRRLFADYLKEAHDIFLRRQTESEEKVRSKDTGLDQDTQPLPELEVPSPEGWQRLTDLEIQASVPPQRIRFADGSTSQAGSWMALFRAVTLKLDSGGHFHPDTVPTELCKLIYPASQKPTKGRRLRLSHGLTISNNWDPKNCKRISIRILEAYGYDPAKVYVK